MVWWPETCKFFPLPGPNFGCSGNPGIARRLEWLNLKLLSEEILSKLLIHCILCKSVKKFDLNVPKAPKIHHGLHWIDHLSKSAYNFPIFVLSTC